MDMSGKQRSLALASRLTDVEYRSKEALDRIRTVFFHNSMKNKSHTCGDDQSRWMGLIPTPCPERTDDYQHFPMEYIGFALVSLMNAPVELEGQVFPYENLLDLPEFKLLHSDLSTYVSFVREVAIYLSHDHEIDYKIIKPIVSSYINPLVEGLDSGVLGNIVFSLAVWRYLIHSGLRHVLVPLVRKAKMFSERNIPSPSMQVHYDKLPPSYTRATISRHDLEEKKSEMVTSQWLRIADMLASPHFVNPVTPNTDVSLHDATVVGQRLWSSLTNEVDTIEYNIKFNGKTSKDRLIDDLDDAESIIVRYFFQKQLSNLVENI